MNIDVVSYSPGPCEIDPKFSGISAEAEIKVEAMPQVRYSDNSNFLGVQIDIEFFADEKRIVRFGFLIGLVVAGWTETFEKGENPTKNEDLIKLCCEKAWLVGTGILMSKSIEQIKHAIVLPSINLDSFVKDVRFIGNSQ